MVLRPVDYNGMIQNTSGVSAQKVQEDNKNSNLVLDGQQRLTSILLSYLGVYPNRESFKKNSQTKIYNNSMDEPQDDEMDSDNMLEWNFTKLLQHLSCGSTEL